MCSRNVLKCHVYALRLHLHDTLHDSIRLWRVPDSKSEQLREHLDHVSARDCFQFGIHLRPRHPSFCSGSAIAVDIGSGVFDGRIRFFLGRIAIFLEALVPLPRWNHCHHDAGNVHVPSDRLDDGWNYVRSWLSHVQSFPDLPLGHLRHVGHCGAIRKRP